MRKFIGFSTGCCHGFMKDALSAKAIELIKKIGSDAIEINWHKAEDRPTSDIIKGLKKCYFEKVSLHLPCNIKYCNGSTSEKTLSDAFELIRQYPFDYCLVHPDLVMDWRAFKHGARTFNCPIAIENMDNRKDSFKDLQMILSFFKRHAPYKLVFDANHWLVNDNGIGSLPAALLMLRQGGVRIAGIHLSGEGYHGPIYKSPHGKEILRHIKEFDTDTDIPVIIESVFADADEMKREYDFVRKNLS